MNQETTGQRLQEQIQDLRDNALSAVKQASTQEEVQQVKARYLGRKGSIAALFSQLGQLPKEKKPKIFERSVLINFYSTLLRTYYD